MEKKIRILILEDEDHDAELISRALRQSELAFTATRVATEAEFVHEIQHHVPDIILSDHGFPSFDGFAALSLARESCPGVPFLFVTGSLGEEVAIASLKNGATDYVLKNRLTYLGVAIQRALREVEEREARQRVEVERDGVLRELKEALAQVKTLSGLLPICSLCKNIRDHQHGWLPLEVYLQRHSDATLTQELCPDCTQRIPPGWLTRDPFSSGLTAES
jgi:CheY-like chemotaxis protein